MSLTDLAGKEQRDVSPDDDVQLRQQKHARDEEWDRQCHRILTALR